MSCFLLGQNVNHGHFCLFVIWSPASVCIELTPFAHLLTPCGLDPHPQSAQMWTSILFFTLHTHTHTNGLTPKTKLGWAHKISAGSCIFKGWKRKGFIYRGKPHAKAHSLEPLRYPCPPSTPLPGALFSYFPLCSLYSPPSVSSCPQQNSLAVSRFLVSDQIKPSGCYLPPRALSRYFLYKDTLFSKRDWSVRWLCQLGSD